jgi:hypothetical protein
MLTSITSPLRLFLAVCLAPLVAILLPARTLLTNNFQEFDSDILILVPYGACTVTLATFIFALIKSLSNSTSKVFIRWYFAITVIILTWVAATSSLQGYVYMQNIRMVLLFLTSVAALIFWKKSILVRLETPFALMTVVILAFEPYYVSQIMSKLMVSSDELEGWKPQKARKASKMAPNIYHIIFDEYQGSVFSKTTKNTPEIMKELEGFEFYPNSLTSFGVTSMAIPAIFSGRMYDFKSPQFQYKYDSTTAQTSLPMILKNNNYKLVAFYHPIAGISMRAFEVRTDERIISSSNILARRVKNEFFELYLSTLLPKHLLSGIVNLGGELDLLEEKSKLPSFKIIKYLKFFDEYLKQEPDLADHGRYTFLHILLPHGPYILSKNCRILKKSTVLEQSSCANLLLLKFVRLLKKLKRYDDSLIVIQSDHGAGVEITEKGARWPSHGKLSEEYSKGRSNNLLLVKPPKSAQKKVKVVNAAFSILQTKKLVCNSLINHITCPVEAKALTEAELQGYYFFKKMGPCDWTDTFYRFKLTSDQKLSADGAIRTKNNPPCQRGSLIN